jgi:hypothetical protein
MNTTPKQLGRMAARMVTRALVAALYLTTAFAIVPALSMGTEASAATDTRPLAEGVLVALALMLVTVGTAVFRWSREEPLA